MNLHHLLNARHAAGKPVRVALIGAGKFGRCSCRRCRTRRGLKFPSSSISIRNARAKPAAPLAGTRAVAATTLPPMVPRRHQAISKCRGSDRQSRGRHSPCPRRDRRRQAYRDGQCRGRRAGGTIARREARKAGVVYSLAYGDQPALTSEMVDWARAIGFRVVAAGKGHQISPGLS